MTARQPASIAARRRSDADPSRQHDYRAACHTVRPSVARPREPCLLATFSAHPVSSRSVPTNQPTRVRSMSGSRLRQARSSCYVPPSVDGSAPCSSAIAERAPSLGKPFPQLRSHRPDLTEKVPDRRRRILLYLPEPLKQVHEANRIGFARQGQIKL